MNESLVEVEEDGALGRRDERREGVVEEEGPGREGERDAAFCGGGGGGGFLQSSVALAFGAVGGGDADQLGKDFEETAVAGEERAADGGDGIVGVDGGFAAVAAAVSGGGSFDDLGHHF